MYGRNHFHLSDIKEILNGDLCIGNTKKSKTTLTLFRRGGARGAFDTTQELNPYYSRTITSTAFLLRGFSSNLSGTEFGVVRFW